MSCPLTSRELQIVALLGEGLTYSEAAARLHVTKSTIRTHINNVNVKLSAPNAAQAFLECVRNGWLDPSAASRQAGELRELELLLTRIAKGIEKRHEDDLTPVQRRYLDAFEARLYAKTSTDECVTENRLSVAFGDMITEAGITIDHKRVQHPLNTTR